MWVFFCIFYFILINNGKSASLTDNSLKPEIQVDFSRGMFGNVIKHFKINFNNDTQLRGIRLPCQCLEGECGCCTGNILQNFNINIKQHFCINTTYEPEDLSIGVKMSINDLVLLSSHVSGKNPPPLCIRLPRVTNIKFCGRFSNVYLINRNIHACITLETEWNERTVFSFNFDCIRLGLNGVAIVSAEAGGGLPHPIDQEVDNIEEYDELLENQTKTPTKKPTNDTNTTVKTPVPLTTTLGTSTPTTSLTNET